MRIRTYIWKRLILVIPVLIGVSFLMFMLLYYLPGDPAEYLRSLEQANVDQQTIQRIREIYGFDQPWYVQYYLFVKRIVTLDMGSFLSGRTVAEEIAARLANTLSVQIAALILAIAIAVPAGTICAANQNTRTDSYVMMGALMGASLPSFFLGLMFIYLFALILGWFPSSGAHSTDFMGTGISHGFSYWLDYLKHMALPTITLSLATAGYMARLVRSSMLNVLREDYVTTARSKGLKERVVIYKHGLKNAVLPVITVLGLRIAVMLGGSPVIETVFAWPGLGRFFVRSVKFRDYQVAVGAALALGIITVLANLAIDITYRLLDPRVSL